MDGGGGGSDSVRFARGAVGDASTAGDGGAAAEAQAAAVVRTKEIWWHTSAVCVSASDGALGAGGRIGDVGVRSGSVASIDAGGVGPGGGGDCDESYAAASCGILRQCSVHLS